MNKFFKILLCLTGTVLMLTSCMEEPELLVTDGEKVAVNFIPNFLDSKGIEVEDSPAIVWLKYEATPEFKEGGVSSSVPGETTESVTIGSITKDSQNDKEYFKTGQVFSQGQWTFDIEVGSGNFTYYVGTVTAYLTGTSEDVTVDLLPYFEENARGSLTLSLQSSKLSSSDGSFVVKFFDKNMNALDDSADVQYQEGDETKEISYNGFNIAAHSNNNQVASAAMTLSFKTGIYYAKIKYVASTDGPSTEESMVAFKIINGSTSELTGSLDNGSYVQTNLGVRFFQGTVEPQTGNSKNYKFVKTNNSYPGTVTVKWFLNGNPIASTDLEQDGSYTFNQTTPGTYYLTCVAVNTFNNDEDVINITNVIKV